MTKGDWFLFIFTFITGMAAGAYLYTMNFRPAYVPVEGLENDETSAQEFSVIGKEYGGFRMEGYVPASFRVTKGGSYTYLSGGVGDEALEEREGTLPNGLARALEDAVDDADLDALAIPATKDNCRHYSDGIDHTYRLTVDGAYYVLDTCRTALPYDHELTEVLGDVWTYLETGTAYERSGSNEFGGGLGGLLTRHLRSYFVDDEDGSEPTACMMDAKICPDGSAVGRTGPNCSFAPCPGE